MLQKHGDKGALPGLELLSTAVDGTFDEGSGGERVGRHIREAHINTIGDALNFFDNGVREWERLLPERLEFFFDPLYAFR
jgi:hypothetical protein